MIKKEFFLWCRYMLTETFRLKREKLMSPVVYLTKDNIKIDESRGDAQAMNHETAVEYIYEKTSDSIPPSLHVIGGSHINYYELDFRNITKRKYINEVIITADSNINLIGGFYEHVKITVNVNNNFRIRIDSCHIRKLTLDTVSTIDIVYSKIGILKFKGPIRNCNIYRSCVLGPSIQTGDITKMITGDLYIDKATYLPTKTDHYARYVFLDNTRVYSIFRKLMQDNGNIIMVNHFHTLELKSSRQYDRWYQNIFSYAFGLFSNFGTSITKPLIILVLSFLLTTWISCAEEAPILLQEETHYKGWLQELVVPENNFERAAVLSAQSILNPYGIISTRNLVVADKDTTTNKLIWLHSLISIISFTMFIFALRRRFKIQT